MSQFPHFEVLSCDDSKQWDKWRSIVKNFKDIDIFYYPEYAYLIELKGDGKARCFVYYDENGIILFPFLERRINELKLFSDIPGDIIDISSPYGYSGYLRNSDRIDMDKFYAVFKEYCKDNNVVSEFIRFHPLIGNVAYVPDGVITNKFNETVVIDLTKSPDDIWGDLTSACRNKIKKARKLGVHVIHDELFENLDRFHELYTDSIQRLGAQEYYYFSLEWFYKLIDLLQDNVALLHATYGDTIIMSGLFIYSDQYMHYYLSGSDYRMSHMAANNLLLYDAALWGKDRGLKYLHLGGGFQPEDNLFRFKASFSKLRTPFFIGNVIHNNEYYYYLDAQRSLSEGTTVSDLQYFPSYRAPAKQIPSNALVKGQTIIIGASGHARVCLDIIIAQGKSVLGFCDDNPNLTGSFFHDYRVIGQIKEIIPFILKYEIGYIIAIGDNDDRHKIAMWLKKYIKQPPINVIHPSAIISPLSIMGDGNFIAPGVIINSDTKLGSYTIINTGAIIDHDNNIYNFAQISPGCNLAGNVTVEEGAFIGTGAVVIPGKIIGAHAVIGAGAVVIHDIPPYSTAVGVPARVIKPAICR